MIFASFIRPFYRSALTIGKSSPTPPPAPDPVAMSQAQSAANVDTATAQARLNAVNQTTPYGSVNYNTIGNETIGGNEVPQYQQTVTLSPAEQNKLDLTNAITGQALRTAGTGIGNVQSKLSQPFSFDGVAPLRTNLGTGDFGAERQRVEDSYMARFGEDIRRQEEDSVSRLNAQGIQRGSEGYGNEMQRLDRAKVDARNTAIQAGGAEQSRLFGMNQADAGFQNQARQQGIQEASMLRSQPINELATLLGLGGQVQAPTGAPNFGIGVGQTDVMGAYGMQQQALQNAFNQKINAQNAQWGALGNLGGEALGGWAFGGFK